MSRITFDAMTVVMSLTLAAPVAAQATAQRPPAACHLPIEADNNATPPAPTVNALPSGCETSTLPWSAPVGHRQPQAAEVTASIPRSIDQELVDENARVDRLIRGVCRGC